MNGPSESQPPVERIEASCLADVVAVQCDAFHDYPTMRFVLGAPGSDYEERLAALIGLFLDTTLLKGGVVFGSRVATELVAAADAVRSPAPEPPELASRRESVWDRLGGQARARYEAYSTATRAFVPHSPYYYLSMLGVRGRCAGRGLTRSLLEKVQALSLADPTSTGVALETEDPGNVSFYQYFGYRLIGHAEIGDGLESWGFFRPDSEI